MVELRNQGNTKIRLAHLLDQKRTCIKLSHIQNTKLDELIFQSLDDAFTIVEPDEITRKLFDKYSTSSFDEEIKAQEKVMSEEFADMFFQNFGVKIDPKQLGGNPDFAKIEEDIKAQYANKNSSAKPRKKTKKQLEREDLEAKREELKTKSLRRIYLSLAKILHPDTEPDETLRLEKEDFMKKATLAYSGNNLLELLRLEMQWISGQGQHLQELDTDTLKAYLQLLKDQVKELEIELEMVYNNPANYEIGRWLDMEKGFADQIIRREAASYYHHTQQLLDSIGQLEKTTKTYSVLMNCVKSYQRAEDENGWHDFLIR